MTVKIFFGTLILFVIVTITGFAYWFFPILNRFHQQLGGAPLKDPRGDWQAEYNLLLNFLPDNNLLRAAFVCGVIVGYFFFSTLAVIIVQLLRKRRLSRTAREESRIRTINSYNARRS